MATHEEILAAHRGGALVQLVIDDIALDDDDTVGRCVELHNEGLIDLFALTSDVALTNLSGHNFFIVQHFLGRAIPELEGPAIEMMELVRLLVALGGDDLASNQPNVAFQKWCEVDARRATRIMELAGNGNDLATQHLSFALVAGHFLEDACAIATTKSGDAQLAAITAISRIAPLSNDEAVIAIAALSSAIRGLPSDAVVAATLWATFGVLEHSPRLPPDVWMPVVRACVSCAAPELQFFCARVLWSHLALLPQETVELFLATLETIDPAHGGTIRELDFALSKLLGSPHGHLVPPYLHAWLTTNEGVDADAFASTARSLLDKSRDTWATTIVDWLLDGDQRCCRTLSSWVSTILRGDAHLDLPAHSIPADDKKRYLLCRRSIGYFFTDPVCAASILLSVARVAEPELKTQIEFFLFEPLLINYGGLKPYLEAVPDSDPAKSTAAAALAVADRYSAALRSMPPIPELYGSERDTQIEQVRWQEKMRRAMKSGRESSVLFGLVHQSTILYGRRSLTRVTDSEGNTKRIPMELNELSTSFELPRLEVLDPVGIDYELRALRVGRLRE